MSNEDGVRGNIGGGLQLRGTPAPRARNKTVLLTPEMTGQMRAKFTDDGDSGSSGGFGAPVSNHESNESGFTPVRSRSVERQVEREPERIVERANERQVEEMPFGLEDDSSHQSHDQEEEDHPHQKEYLEQHHPDWQNSFEAPQPIDHRTQPHPAMEAPRSEAREVIQPMFTPQINTTPQNTHAFTPPPEREMPPKEYRKSERGEVVQKPFASGFVPEGLIWVKETQIVGVLLCYDRLELGEVFLLRVGRLIITSDKEGMSRLSSYLYLNDDTVSPNHAIMKVSHDGGIEILDQLSDSGTMIQKYNAEEEVELLGEKMSVSHGDIIRFGQLRFHVCVLAREG
jgi:hypothetical protein